jgi:hypothetical protein
VLTEGCLRLLSAQHQTFDIAVGNSAILRVIAIPIVDRLKPNIPGGKTLGNLKPFSAK